MSLLDLRLIDFCSGPEEGEALERFRRDALEGLRASPKRLSPKYFYDRRGSELFEEICGLEEYYPTRTETAILGRSASDISEALGEGVTLIELGSGASRKTRLLLDEVQAEAYIPVDISRSFLLDSATELSRDYQEISVVPICADYARAFDQLDERLASYSKKVLFFPGSTVGNFEKAEARSFFRQCASLLGPGGRMLLGFDLLKDTGVIEAAYNDERGVTAQFNLNLLARMNRELGADFDLRSFRHSAFFNPREQRIEMHLVSLKAQRVKVAGETIEFSDGESIHTESSHKYTLESLMAMASRAGFSLLRSWSDERRYFCVALLEVERFAHREAAPAWSRAARVSGRA